MFAARLGLVIALSMFASAARAEHDWETSATASYASSGALRGGGVVLSGLWVPSEYFATGLMFDAVHLGQSGVANAGPYNFRFLSMFVGAMAQLRVPIGRFVPYVDLELGGTIVDTLESNNMVCGVGSGVGAGAGGGLKVAIASNMALGARVSARLPAGTVGCSDIPGYTRVDYAPLFLAGGSFELQW